jgi:hypothetical protein
MARTSKAKAGPHVSIPNARAIEQAAAAVWVDIGELKPWADNPRFNAGRPVDVVAESVRMLGWGRPLGACRGQLVWGHTARLAALKLCAVWTTMSEAKRKAALGKDPSKRWHPEAIHTAETGRVPVRFREDLTERQAEQMALADNRTNELAQNDMPRLLELLSRFDAMEAEAIGYTSAELSKMADNLLAAGILTRDEADVEEDEAPDPPAIAVTQVGDVWILGRHVLICGDATEAAIWADVADGSIGAVFTDPPYGVDYVGKTADALPVLNDGKKGHKALLEKSFDALLPKCREGSPWYVCWPEPRDVRRGSQPA